MRSTRFVSAATLAFALLASTAAHAQNSFRNDGRDDRQDNRRDFREQQRFDEQRQREERFRFEQSRFDARSDDRFESQRFENRRDFGVGDPCFVEHRFGDHHLEDRGNNRPR